ncbi:MAG: RHS repeat-associated core domain-containing protein, partial [Terracidiphilus sp.]
GILSPSDGNAMGTFTEQYQYDLAGNLMALIHKGSDPANPGWSRAYTYNEASLLVGGQLSNRLSSTAISGNMPLNEPYSYDLHGNMSSMPQLSSMRWDFKDMLVMTTRQAVNASDQPGIASQGMQTWYDYNSAGERTRKTTLSPAGIKLRERFYLGGYEVYREYDNNGNTTLESHTLHVMDGSRRIALVETTTVDTSAAASSLPTSLTRYQYDNHLGSACLELDSTGAVVTYEEYYPFGSTSYQAGASLTEVNQKRYRYIGKERDVETGLNYHGARYYALWLGRWTSCDPTGTKDGLNLYAYVRNRPITLVDPKGTDGNTTQPVDVPPNTTVVTVTDQSGHVVSTSTNSNSNDTSPGAQQTDNGPDPGLPSLTTTQSALGLPRGYQGVESFPSVGGVAGSTPAGRFGGPSFSLGTALRYGLFPAGGRGGGDLMLFGILGGQSSTSGFGGGASLGVTPHFWLGTSESFARLFIYGTAAANLGQSPSGAFPVSPYLQILPGLELGGRQNDPLTVDINLWANYNRYSQDATGAPLENQGTEGVSAQVGIKTDPDSKYQFGPEVWASRYSAGIPGAGPGDPTSATGFALGGGFFIQETVSGNSATERSAWGVEPYFQWNRDSRGPTQTDTYTFGVRVDLGGNRKTTKGN